MNSTAVSTTPCTLEEAQQLTQKLMRSLTDSWHLLHEAFVRRVWEPHGYGDWESYCADALSTPAFRLSPEWRQQVVAQLSSGAQPMSNRAIGAALGVSDMTVARDLKAAAGATNVAPAPEQAAADAFASADEDEILDAEIVEDTADQPQPPQKRLGADGKTYPVPARSVPPPKPRRKPLIDDFTRAAHDLLRVARRLAPRRSAATCSVPRTPYPASSTGCPQPDPKDPLVITVEIDLRHRPADVATALADALGDCAYRRRPSTVSPSSWWSAWRHAWTSSWTSRPPVRCYPRGLPDRGVRSGSSLRGFRAGGLLQNLVGICRSCNVKQIQTDRRRSTRGW
jgi:hypothetical protein